MSFSGNRRAAHRVPFRSHGRGRRAILAASLLLSLAACDAPQKVEQVPLQTVVVTREERKIPLHVALLIPETPDAAKVYKVIPNICIAAMIEPKYFRIGAAFEEDARASFLKVYQSAEIVRSLKDAAKDDAIIELNLTEVGHRVSCGFSSTPGYTAQGYARALSADGKELWRSQTVKKSVDGPSIDTMSVTEYYSLSAHEMSQAMAQLIDDWIQALRTQDPTRYASMPKPKIDDDLATGAAAEARKDYAGALSIYLAALQKDSSHGLASVSELVERAIDVSFKMRPRPAVGPDALKHASAAVAGVKNAHNKQDFEAAQWEYQNALALAPWWTNAWFNLAALDEQLDDVDGARFALQSYLRSSPEAPDRATIAKRLHDLEGRVSR
jgi:tetratricopeptide (TPR) repeat protein